MSNDTNLALALSPRTFNEAREIAEYCSHAAILPAELRRKPADILCIIATGQELGLAPMAAIRGIHMIKGKPVMSADAMVAVVLGSGLAEYFTCLESSDERAVYETKRRGSPQAERATFTVEDARRAKLLGRGNGGGDSNWDKYRAVMLGHRARSILARRVYPDVLLGVYSEGELSEDRSPTDYIDAEVLEPPPPPADPPAEIDPTLIEMMDRASSQSELDDLARVIADWSEGPRKKEAREAYRRNRERIARRMAALAAVEAEIASADVAHQPKVSEPRRPQGNGVTGEQIAAAIEAADTPAAISEVAKILAPYHGPDREALHARWRERRQDKQEGS